MKGRVEIRPVRVDDLREMYLLGCKYFGDKHSSFEPAWNETNLADILARDQGLSLVAVTKNNILGFLVASLERAGGVQAATISWLCAGQSITPGLMDDMLQVFRSSVTERHIDKIVITLPERNTELIEYYRNFGFTESNRFIIMENFLPKK